jgi:hypothetical protein
MELARFPKVFFRFSMELAVFTMVADRFTMEVVRFSKEVQVNTWQES